MPEQAQSPFYNFPRFFPMRGGGGGYQAGNAGAISRFGDDIAQSLMQIKAQMDQKKQDELANAMMNNGQSPGAAPYVRRAEYPDGDQGDDPGPTPFASTDQPYSGGQQQQATLAGAAQDQQKAQQQALAASLANRRLDLQGQRLSMGSKGRPMSDYEQYGVDNPNFIPPSQRRQFAPGRGKKSNLLPPSLGDDNLPTNEPPMAPPTTSSPSQPSGLLGNIYNSVMSAISGGGPGGGSPDAAPEAAPSATPLIAQTPTVTSQKDFDALPSGTVYLNAKTNKRATKP